MDRLYNIYHDVYRLLIIVFIASCLPQFNYGQSFTAGCLADLANSNGFKGIKLGADVRKLPQDKLYYLDGNESEDADSCLKFEYRDPDILKLNGVTLNLVGLRTYNSKIINIYLFFKRDDGYKILQNFVAVYGKCTNKPGDFMYDWRSDNVNLSLRYQLPSDLGVAIFTSNPIEDHLALERQKTKKNLIVSDVSGKSL